MSSPNSLDKATVLAQRFTAELERASRLGVDSFVLLQPAWIMGTVLLIGVPSPEIWKKLLSVISRAVETSGMIRDAYITTDTNAICLQMALDGWAGSRKDRSFGSPMLSALNGLDADSTSVPQAVKIIRSDHVNLTLRSTSDIRMIDRFDEYQLLAHYLRLSLRLSADDLGTFLDLFINDGGSNPSRTRLTMEGGTEEEQSMLGIVRAALSFAREKGFLDASILGRILNPTTLVQLGEKYDISAADRSFAYSWSVLVRLEGNSSAEALRRKTPSFFVRWPEIPNCKPQVHVLETPILGNRDCVLLTFEDKPEEAEVDNVLDRLRDVLKLDPVVKMLSTVPFAKGQNKRIAGYSREKWIRVDGMLKTSFHDQVLCPHLRDAIERQKETTPRDPGKIVCPGDRFLPDRPPQCFVIYARQGKEDGHRARAAIPKQLSTTVRSDWFTGRSNSIFRPDKDKIFVVEESCSTNGHPCQDRTGMSGLPRDMPRVFLTTNPDRLTCRADEIDQIVGGVEGDCWFTQGIIKKGGPEDLPGDVKEGVKVEDWYEVEGDMRVIVEAQLLLNRKRHIEAGTYSRGDAAATNLNNYLKRMEGNYPTQVQSLQKAIRHTIKAHGFSFILIWGRTSPSRKTTDGEGTNSSIERQIQYLEHAVAGCGIELRYEKAAGVSASDGGAVDQLERALQDCSGKILVLTTRPDRMTRSVKEFGRLQKIIGPGGHGIMSFLWDFETRPSNVCEALRLAATDSTHEAVIGWENALEEQKRAPIVRLNRPVHQPILWMVGTDTSHPSYLCGYRHAKSAQEWSKAQVTVNYQGDPNIEPELNKRNPNKKGVPDEMVEAQEAFLRHKYPVQIDISFHVVHGGPTAYTCSCAPESAHHTHDVDCQCACESCAESRSCSCTVRKCFCPPLCNCNCNYCHKKVCKKAPAWKDQDGDRRCIGKDCKTMVRKKTLRCPRCAYLEKVERVCFKSSCSRYAPHGDYGGHGKYCAQCCEEGEEDEDETCRRMCQEDGCQNLAPRGCKTGTHCPECHKQHNAAVRENKKRKRDADDVGE